MVENMSSSTADALGLSRAILCNDSLIKKLEELERTEFMYTGLIDHTRRMLRAYFDVFLVFKGELRIVRVAHYICHEIMQSWQHCTLFRNKALTLKKLFAFIFLEIVPHS